MRVRITSVTVGGPTTAGIGRRTHAWIVVPAKDALNWLANSITHWGVTFSSEPPINCHDPSAAVLGEAKAVSQDQHIQSGVAQDML